MEENNIKYIAKNNFYYSDLEKAEINISDFGIL